MSAGTDQRFAAAVRVGGAFVTAARRAMQVAGVTIRRPGQAIPMRSHPLERPRVARALPPLALAILVALVAGAGPVVQAQEPGAGTTFREPFLDSLQGDWRFRGVVQGDSVAYRVRGDWVLGHQFFRLTMVDASPTPQYEAHVYIGDDPLSERYVVHWLDVFGGRFSETLGHGRWERDRLRIVFEYPDGPFHTMFVRGKGGAWGMELRSKGRDGRWTAFADYVAARPVP